MAPVSARGLVFLNPDVLRHRKGRSLKNVFDPKRVAAFQQAVLKFQHIAVVLNGTRRDAVALAALKASLPLELAALLVDRVDLSRRGRFGRQKRLEDWYRLHCSPNIPWVAVEPTRRGYRSKAKVLECARGFDIKAGAHLEDMLVWRPGYERSYPNDMLDWGGWLKRAKRLLDSVRLLEPHFREAVAVVKQWLDSSDKPRPMPNFDVGYSYFLLAGLALEGILKAELVLAEGQHLREKYEETGRLPDALRNHDLYRLATRAGMRISLEEEVLLRRITQHVEWYSRYPIPAEPGDLFVKFSNGIHYPLRTLSPGDMDGFEAFVRRVTSEFGFDEYRLEKPKTQD